MHDMDPRAWRVMSEGARRKYIRRHNPRVPEAPTHEWLWDNDLFSDMTLELRPQLRSGAPAGGVAGGIALPSPPLAPASAVGCTDQPRKRVRDAACRCPQLLPLPPQAAEQPLPAPQTGEQSAVTQGGALQSCHDAGFTCHTLHRSVLSCTSGFFKRLLTTSMGGWCDACKVASLTLEPRELEAAPHVLRFMYSHELPRGDDKDGQEGKDSESGEGEEDGKESESGEEDDDKDSDSGGEDEDEESIKSGGGDDEAGNRRLTAGELLVWMIKVSFK